MLAVIKVIKDYWIKLYNTPKAILVFRTAQFLFMDYYYAGGSGHTKTKTIKGLCIFT